ncbi:UPF0146 family protein [Haloquadratum walsbyi]|uniref:UPF0146 protein J07HQW2_02749 n=1 Tax=Haloquadratum walsbyi J07HQW2 TaxID=1238425 RepID=U1N0F2_9EURY|nr:UPF0146 family protein [Haloquadratum walsbyi]ERG96274.1 MAG: uncharacterized protein conserved in archaea [Haloquadratum walsbyi J07HQW2]
MCSLAQDALVKRFSRYESAVEVGIGNRPAVAVELASRGIDIVATDIVSCPVPDSVTFVRDDIVATSKQHVPKSLYDVELLYALNLPPELHRPFRDVADAVGADCRLTTLGYDVPVISCHPVSLPGGETVYIVESTDTEGECLGA